MMATKGKFPGQEHRCPLPRGLPSDLNWCQVATAQPIAASKITNQHLEDRVSYKNGWYSIEVSCFSFLPTHSHVTVTHTHTQSHHRHTPHTHTHTHIDTHTHHTTPHTPHTHTTHTHTHSMFCLKQERKQKLLYIISSKHQSHTFKYWPKNTSWLSMAHFTQSFGRHKAITRAIKSSCLTTRPIKSWKRTYTPHSFVP